jgi:hypothetical protein
MGDSMSDDPLGFVRYWHRIGPTACHELAMFVRSTVIDPAQIVGQNLRPTDRGLTRVWHARLCSTCRSPLPLPLPTPDGRDEVEV